MKLVSNLLGLAIAVGMILVAAPLLPTKALIQLHTLYAADGQVTLGRTLTLPTDALMTYEVGNGRISLPAECYTRERVAEVLLRYRESPTGIGIAANGTLLEIWTSPEGTWTAVIIQPNGQHCPVASGEGWTTRARTPQGVDG